MPPVALFPIRRRCFRGCFLYPTYVEAVDAKNINAYQAAIRGSDTMLRNIEKNIPICQSENVRLFCRNRIL